jgi:hypothetical protein
VKIKKTFYLITSFCLVTATVLQFTKSISAATEQWSFSNGNAYFLDGRVGIGTTNPAKKLEVAGSMQIGRSDGASLAINTLSGSVRLNTQGSDLIITSGNVGIGTFDPTKKLSVNGTIRAKEIIVDSGWADFVFEPDYKLISLEELDSYIKQNKHLPDLPTSSEVSQAGVALGEVISRLLQKVEELTLYTIQQQQEINHLNNIILNK